MLCKALAQQCLYVLAERVLNISRCKAFDGQWFHFVRVELPDWHAHIAQTKSRRVRGLATTQTGEGRWKASTAREVGVALLGSLIAQLSGTTLTGIQYNIIYSRPLSPRPRALKPQLPSRIIVSATWPAVKGSYLASVQNLQEKLSRRECYSIWGP